MRTETIVRAIVALKQAEQLANGKDGKLSAECFICASDLLVELQSKHPDVEVTA